jgi:hypothetical protein
MAARPVVISLHGIRTRGAWQKELTAELNRAGFDHVPLDFGFFRALQLLWPRARQRLLQWFLKEYTVRRLEYGDAHVSAIAHSFGTYLIARALERFPEVTFDRVIFCGSIVRQDFPWTRIVDARQVVEVLHEYGRLDVWAKLVGWVVSDAGPSGARGFDDSAAGRVVQRERLDFKHSDYFYLLNYKKNWIPFLRGLGPGPLTPLEQGSPNWRYRATLIGIAVLVPVLLFALLVPVPVPRRISAGYTSPSIFRCESFSSTACGLVDYVDNELRIASEGASVYLWSGVPLVDLDRSNLSMIEFDVLSTASDQEVIFGLSRDRRKFSDAPSDAVSFSFAVAGTTVKVRKGLFETYLHERQMGEWAANEWIHVALAIEATGRTTLTVGKQTEIFDLRPDEINSHPYFGFVMWDQLPTDGKPRTGKVTYRNVRVENVRTETWVRRLLNW